MVYRSNDLLPVCGGDILPNELQSLHNKLPLLGETPPISPSLLEILGTLGPSNLLSE